MGPSHRPSTVLGFFSFKGGVGRTLAAIHTAYFLKRIGKRVLLVDADLEAPGLSHWNAAPAIGEGGPPEVGLQQLLVAISGQKDAAAASSVPESIAAAVENALVTGAPELARECIEQFLRPGDFLGPGDYEFAPRPRGQVRLLSSGRGVTGPDLTQYLRGLPIALGTLARNPQALHALLSNAGFDVVIIDNRTGLHSGSAASFNTLSDYHVVLFGPGVQNFMGLVTMLQLLSAKTLDRTLFVMSPMPSGGFGRFRDAEKAIRTVSSDPSQRVRLIPIHWHATLASQECLIPELDPLSETAQNYRTLFRELQTLRGAGVDAYTQRLDALLDIYKYITYKDRAIRKPIDTCEAAFPREPIERRTALWEHIRRLRSAATRDHEGGSEVLMRLLLWEMVDTFDELRELHREASEALWRITILRNTEAGVADAEWLPNKRLAHEELLWILVDSFSLSFGLTIADVSERFARPADARSSTARCDVDEFLATVGGAS